MRDLRAFMSRGVVNMAFGLFGVALGLVVTAVMLRVPSVDAQTTTTQSGATASTPDEASAQAPPAESGDQRSWGPSADDLVAVAADVSSDWGAALRLAKENDPDGFKAQLQDLRRLRSLALLKQRDPAAYSHRISELKLDRRARELAAEYALAAASADTELRADLERQIVDLSLKLVDANLRSRAAELASLVKLVDDLRDELQQDSAQREVKANEVAQALLSGQPIPELGGRSPRWRR